MPRRRPTQRWGMLFAILAGVSAAGSAQAADITARAVGSVNIIDLSGKITEGDADKFEQVAGSVDNSRPTLVRLDSLGGRLVEGVAIGDMIRSAGYRTVVPNDAICASSCGLIWLAGKVRYVASTGKVGFHAAYAGEGDQVHEVGSGNALVGAFLSKLGLSYDAIYFATSAPPDRLNWLTLSDSRRVGIDFVELPDPPPRPVTAATAPAKPSQDAEAATREGKAEHLVTAYFQAWSQPGPDVQALAEYYRDSVVFYGASLAREKIMVEKRKFSLRWPARQYAIRPGTLVADCAELCVVTGIVEWDVNSPARNERSIGAANFVLKIRLDGNRIGGAIVFENGLVLSGRKMALAAIPSP